MRVDAARQLGWTEFPVVRVDLDDAQARLLNLALNRIHGEWDEAMLAEMLAGLRDEDADLLLSGFDTSEIDRLLASVDGPGGDTEPMEPPAEPVTQLGDLIVLGEHRLLCGDSSDPLALDRVSADVTVGCVLTDPPYGIDTDATRNGANRLAGQRGRSSARIAAGHVTQADRRSRSIGSFLNACFASLASSSGSVRTITAARSARATWTAHGSSGTSAH